MMYPTRPPLNQRFTDPPTDDVDGLLRRFYRAEMSQPWPAAPRVSDANKTMPAPPSLTVRRFLRLPARFALVAAVALLVIGYLTLQACFPDAPLGSGQDFLPDMTQPKAGNLPRPNNKMLDHTPSGRPVRVEESRPGPGRVILTVEELPGHKK